MVLLRSCRGFLPLLALVGVAYCYPYFQQQIPNGEVVPHPCNSNYIWKGVGHIARGGGGQRNDFGTDFSANRKVWTRTLCMMDSDGDGKTNGQELGDPECVWSPGQAPAFSAGLSHPGICEPIDSPQCQEQASFVVCEKLEFVCPVIDEPDTIKLPFRFPETPVPAEETTYMCMGFEFPEGDYHMVATTPIVDNINVMHHVIVSGCNADANLTGSELNKPYNCFMTGKQVCHDIIGLWTVGIDGQCIHEDTGFRVGSHPDGHKWVIIEIHWNNPALQEGWTDSSGMNFYLTPNKRLYDAGTLMIGQNFLMIPPGEERYVESGTLPSTCTRQLMKGPVSVIGAGNHMHYLGAAATSYVTTPSGEVTYLAKDDTYSYDSPTWYSYDEPIQINPGDELTLDCHFKSTSRTKTTFRGESTNAEMCLAVAMYYPKENFRLSVLPMVLDMAPCEMASPVIKGCDFAALNDLSNPETIQLYSAVLENCAVGSCRKECKPVAQRMKEHPCFSGTPKVLQMEQLHNSESTVDLKSKYESLLFWASLESCNEELLRDRIDKLIENGSSNAAALAGRGIALMTSAGFLVTSVVSWLI